MSWKESDNALTKSYKFKDFSEAFAFLSRVALLAEKHAHHPEIHNVYNQVDLRLSTHDEGNKVTAKDRELASAIEALEG